MAHARSVEGLLERDLEVLDCSISRYNSCAVVSTSALDSVDQLRFLILLRLGETDRGDPCLGCAKGPCICHVPLAAMVTPCVPDSPKTAEAPSDQGPWSTMAPLFRAV